MIQKVRVENEIPSPSARVQLPLSLRTQKPTFFNFQCPPGPARRRESITPELYSLIFKKLSIPLPNTDDTTHDSVFCSGCRAVDTTSVCTRICVGRVIDSMIPDTFSRRVCVHTCMTQRGFWMHHVNVPHEMVVSSSM